MNAERLRAFVESLLKDEERATVQDRLDKLTAALSRLASSPQEPSHQTEVANGLQELAKQLSILIAQYDAAQNKRLAEIGAFEFFSMEIISEIEQAIKENPLSPTIVHQQVASLTKRRKVFLQSLEATAKNLDSLGIRADELEVGTAEIGFLIPRDFFDSELEGLIEQLGNIRLIVRAFSELAVGTAEPIIVRQISTSDPTFSFVLDVKTIGLLAAAVTWALKTWKDTLQIRKLRHEALDTKTWDEKEIKKFFDDKIEETIKTAVEKRATELLGPPDGKAGRKAEFRNHVEWALRTIFAKIERGLTIEIRLLPPPASDEVEAEPKEKERRQNFENAQKLVPELVFPEPNPSPVLELPPNEPPGAKEAQKKD